eukprot:362130-Chlamydomonas_euryale.AAC.2
MKLWKPLGARPARHGEAARLEGFRALNFSLDIVKAYVRGTWQAFPPPHYSHLPTLCTPHTSSGSIDVGSATLMEFHGPPADTPPRVRCVNSMTHITIEPAVQAELQATSSGVAEVSME